MYFTNTLIYKVTPEFNFIFTPLFVRITIFMNLSFKKKIISSAGKLLLKALPIALFMVSGYSKLTIAAGSFRFLGVLMIESQNFVFSRLSGCGVTVPSQNRLAYIYQTRGHDWLGFEFLANIPLSNAVFSSMNLCSFRAGLFARFVK